ncbi:MAG: vitamin K epoxide reductase family protein [Candidatus Korobacteraceae bacterium]
MSRDAIPPGWDYNPSTWPQRIPIVVLAVIGFVIAAYLALYQWRIVTRVWEPFFGDGSERILNSGISHVLPIPDAALGALGYLADAVTGLIGGRARWRTMPWMVIVFGLAVGPLGFVSVLLVVLQPTVLGAWCTLCLASAVISVLMIGPAMDELLASLQHLRRVRDQGGNLWGVFWGREEAQDVRAAA